MRRFLVGLLATLGALAILLVAGVGFAAWWFLRSERAGPTLPPRIVLELDLRQDVPESSQRARPRRPVAREHADAVPAGPWPRARRRRPAGRRARGAGRRHVARLCGGAGAEGHDQGVPRQGPVRARLERQPGRAGAGRRGLLPRHRLRRDLGPAGRPRRRQRAPDRDALRQGPAGPAGDRRQRRQARRLQDGARDLHRERAHPRQPGDAPGPRRSRPGRG